MINIHKSEDRGTADHGWLQAKFSFSFADYYNENRMGFGKLRVLNNDVIAPGKGFGKHPHENMEIITIPLKGKVAHEDSTGSKETIGPGQVQVMSAGSGVVHSEFNASETDPLELFQMWIETKEQDIEPRHDTKTFELPKNNLMVVASGLEDENTLYIHQDATILLGNIDEYNTVDYNIEKGNGLFVVIIEGEASIDGKELKKRDSAEITDTETVSIKMLEDSYVLLIEVPM